MPGANDFGFNSSQPYAFVGQDFASWKAYKVEIAGNECNSCHRLGVNNVRSGLGTALDFALRATSADEKSDADMRDAHKNLPSADLPIWMPPPEHVPPLPEEWAFNQAHFNSAMAIHNCAVRLHEDLLPDNDECRITQFAGAVFPRCRRSC